MAKRASKTTAKPVEQAEETVEVEGASGQAKAPKALDIKFRVDERKRLAVAEWPDPGVALRLQIMSKDGGSDNRVTNVSESPLVFAIMAGRTYAVKYQQFEGRERGEWLAIDDLEVPEATGNTVLGPNGVTP